MRTVSEICRALNNSTYIMISMAKPIKTLETLNPIIQITIITDILKI